VSDLDLIFVREDRIHALYISPWIDTWPRPDFLIYPIVAASDAGARTVILRMIMRDAPWGFRKTLRLTIDGEPVALPLDRPNAVTEDNGGCRSVTRVSVGGQEAVLARIARAGDVRVLFGSAGRFYRLDADDLARARRMLEVFRGAELPSDDLVFDLPDRDVTLPERVGQKISPKFPEPARKTTQAEVKVTLAATIGEDGSVRQVRILEASAGDCGFEEASLEAVRQWKYKPGTRMGRPAAMNTKIVVTFFKG
jgi:TonB family protein